VVRDKGVKKGLCLLKNSLYNKHISPESTKECIKKSVITLHPLNVSGFILQQKQHVINKTLNM
jgi:hypothetical protein